MTIEGKKIENGKVSIQFGRDQLVSASVMARQFGRIKQAVQHKPLYITDNGRVDSVLINFEQYEELLQQLHELEQEVLKFRMEEAEREPNSSVDWNSIHRESNE